MVGVCLTSPLDALAADSIAGSWKLNGNNYIGVMEITGSDGSFRGRFKYDIHGNWEDMVDLNILGNSISFTRAHANQKYSGRLSGSSISGSFSQGGLEAINGVQRIEGKAL